MASLPGPDNITRVVLDNGITVLVYENYAAQSVVIAGSLAAGSNYELFTSKEGLAAMTSGALMRGTHHRDFDAIHATLEEIGADLGIGANGHTTSFQGKSLAEDLNVLIDMLADVVRNPVFPPQQVERMRGEILTGLQIRQQDTRYRASRAFRENLFPPEHPYHYSIQGTLDTIPGITLEDMRSFHSKYYGPRGMLVTVVGAIEAQKAVDIVQQYLGDWQNSNQPGPLQIPAAPSPTKIRRIDVSLPGKTQSDLVMGGMGPSRFDDTYEAATLANSILGQFGMMGRIGAEVRERLGLAYYAFSRLEGGIGAGPWGVTAGVSPANVQLAVDSIVNEIRRITTELVSEEDLADNQANYTGHLPLQLESNEGLAGAILNMEIFELGLDYLVKYHDTIYSITREDLLAAAQLYLNPDAYILAVAGPELSQAAE